MTGAPVPAGCDCVLRQEDTDYGTEAVELHTRLRPGDNICRTGEDFFAGELLLSRGMRLNAVALGVLAAAGIDRVRVRRRPRCAVMCTGDELAPAGMRPLPRGKIYSANDALLRARLAQWGMELLPGPACWADDPDALARAMAEIRADAIFTTGGVSVGARDILHQALPLLGAERLFWRVALKPGSPLMFSMYHQTPILSLSGNPFAAMTTLELFGRPLLSGLLDTDSLLLRPFPAVLDTPFPKGGIRRFVRGFFQGGHVTLAATNASGQLRSAAEANCLVELRMPAEAGTTVPVYLL